MGSDRNKGRLFVHAYRNDCGVRFLNAAADPSLYFELFETTGWNRNYMATPGEIEQALQKSWYTVSAYEGEELVGSGRIVSDSVLYAMIYDLIVRPSHQNRGIGTAILQRLLRRCKNAGIREIQLFCAKGKSGFYGKRGFRDRPSDAPGMIYVLDQ